MWVEVVEENYRNSLSFHGSPVNRKSSWKKTEIEKKSHTCFDESINLLIIDIIKFYFTGYYYSKITRLKWTRFFESLELLFKKFSFCIKKDFGKFLGKVTENCLISNFMCSHLVWSSLITCWSRIRKDSDVGSFNL